MTMHDRITKKLTDGLSPATLEVLDESHQHAGHGGWREGGETHFRVKIASSAFNGLSLLAQHRLVNGLLAAELAEGVHALALETRAISAPPA